MNSLYILSLFVSVPFILFPAAFVWYVNGGGLYQALKKRRARGKQKIEKLVCSVDTDCPEGHICINGRCLPA